MLSDRTQTELHGKTARMLEELSPESPKKIAHHHDRTRAAGDAARWYVRSAFDHENRDDSLGMVHCIKRTTLLKASANFELSMTYAEALRFLGRHEDQELALAV